MDSAHEESVHVFPELGDDTARLVTEARLARARSLAVRILRQHADVVQQIFAIVAHEASNKVRGVRVDTDKIISRCRKAVLRPLPDLYGISDDEEVHISSMHPMQDAEVVHTVLHEAMHYSVKVDRGYGYRFMCTRDEHQAMAALGDS